MATIEFYWSDGSPKKVESIHDMTVYADGYEYGSAMGMTFIPKTDIFQMFIRGSITIRNKYNWTHDGKEVSING